jgi:hypothetical protein
MSHCVKLFTKEKVHEEMCEILLMVLWSDDSGIRETADKKR